MILKHPVERVRLAAVFHALVTGVPKVTSVTVQCMTTFDGDCTAYFTLSNLRADLVIDGGGVLVLRLGGWIWGDGDPATNEGGIGGFNGDGDPVMGEGDLDRVSGDSWAGGGDAVDWNRNGGDCTISGLNPGGGDTIEKTGIGGKI